MFRVLLIFEDKYTVYNNTVIHCISIVYLFVFYNLQHLVRLSWDEFTSEEKINFANAAISLISEMVDPREEWALKSQTTALVAEVFFLLF